jgi:hypothetical protein
MAFRIIVAVGGGTEASFGGDMGLRGPCLAFAMVIPTMMINAETASETPNLRFLRPTCGNNNPVLDSASVR